MAEQALHICIGESAGGTLRQAGFARQGSKVVAFDDDLSFGPIDPPDPSARLVWGEREFGFGRDYPLAEATEKFWTAALSAPLRRIFWFSRRSACEYAGFLECLWRFDDTACDVVDVTDFALGRRPILGLGELSADNIRDAELVHRAEPLGPALRAAYRERWRQLRAENAPFRIVRDLKLVSAPITVHDDLLLRCAVAEWQSAALVIGQAMVNSEDQVGDLALFGRLRKLVAAGALEARGGLAFMSSEVRLPFSREAGRVALA